MWKSLLFGVLVVTTARAQSAPSAFDFANLREDVRTLTQRVEQLKTGLHWAEEPMSRTCHIYTNARVLDATEEAGTRRVTAKTRFFVYRNRLQTDVDLLVGKRVDELVADGVSGWKIRSRIVYLDQTVLMSNNLTTFL